MKIQTKPIQKAPSRTLDLEPTDPVEHDRLRLWLRLLRSVMLIESEVRVRLQSSFGVTLPQFDLMAQLDRASGELTMGELSAQLMVSNGNVTGIVDRLERDGLVARYSSTTDRRAWIVRLTTTGRATFKRMAGRHEGWINQLFSDLSKKDIDQLMTILARTQASVRGSIAESALTKKSVSPSGKRKKKVIPAKGVSDHRM